jgi:uncharacterized membrane protein
MNTGRFLKHLCKELPSWREQGWVTQENSEAILCHVEQQAAKTNFLAFAIAILGVLLLGSGIITYFAANWKEMSKLAKLFILLGSLYGAYLAGGYLISNEHSPKIGQACLLLGVILFGANIMLIAQIYHIDSHYPNGVLLWSLGGLLTAYLLRAQATLVAAIALATLWTGMESFGFDHIHGWYLLLWLAFLPAIHHWHWQAALHIALISLLLWTVFSWINIDNYWGKEGYLYLVQLYFVCYLSLFVAGMLMHSFPRLEEFSRPLQGYSVIGALFCLYALTFPRLQSGLGRYYDSSFRVEAEPLWITATFIALSVLFGLSLWHRQRVYTQQRSRYLLYAQLLVGATILLILLNLFVSGVHGSWIAMAFNLIYFAGMVWLVFAGMALNNRFLINIAFIFFALGLLTRYFDTFWTLLNRSFFFMAGGLILIAGGYFLEQQRRRINAQVLQSREQEGQS